MNNTTKIMFYGGPLDGKAEWRELHHSQEEIRCLVPPPPPTPNSENELLKTGRYVRTKTHEGLAVFEWRGVVGGFATQ